MSRPRRPRPPRRPPDWLHGALGVAAQLVAVSLTAAVLHGVGVTPIAGTCSGGPPVAAVVKGNAGRMPESAVGIPGGVEARDTLTRVNVVGRDGIEPPTLRFSAARSTD
jgi:hypothetical protein